MSLRDVHDMPGAPTIGIGIVAPPSFRPRSPTERLRDELTRVRSLPYDERHITLPGEHTPRGQGLPPSGMFVIHPGERKP